MYNTDLPKRSELPSAKQLILSTITAIIIAVLLLVTTVLPAEYGIDPTGVGRILGLTEMGEIKTSLEQEAQQDEIAAQQALIATQAQPAMQQVQATNPEPTPSTPVMEIEPHEPAPQVAAVPTNTVEPVSSPAVTTPAPMPAEVPATAPVPSEQQVTVLKPGAGIEIKLKMEKDAQVNYQWRVDQGHLNYDLHADNATTSYHPYKKGLKLTSDEGVLTAAFTGGHGWFWRNRSKQDVTLTLDIEGEFQSVYRVK